MNTNLITRSTLLAATVLLLVAGCSYDNSLYNARKYFNSAQARPLNPQGRPTPQSIDDYMKTITKCGYILTERPNSKEADDALFLLAKSLYYRGNSQFQAKDQFQSLMRNFPDSPYVPEAVLYLAKTMRQVNESAEAENLLTAFIRNPETEKNHPKAILLLADFAVQDNDNVKAQYWLERILTEYKGSVHAKEALFLLGVNLYEQQEHFQSLEQLRKVVSSRGMNRSVKLDARLYIALNYFHLNELQKSIRVAKRLLRDEDRPEKVPAVRLVIGRILLAMKEETEAVEELQSIIKGNARTVSSAEAYFRLAEYYFYMKGDIQLALENYNKAKTESSASLFQPEATRKHTALLQINQKTSIKVSDNPQLYIDAKVESAENYMIVLDMPDSAFVMLDKIAQVPQDYMTAIDSLLTVRSRLSLEIDSLLALVDTVAVQIALPDSTAVTKADSIPAADSLIISDIEQPAPGDTTTVDEIAVETPLKDTGNKTVPKDDIGKIGNSKITQTPAGDSNSARLNELQEELIQVEKLLSDNQDILAKFEIEYIPFSKFVKATLIFKKDPASDKLNPIYTDMETQYPGNKYTLALQMMLEGKQVRLVDTAMDAEEAELDFALSNIATEPDTSLIVLRRLAASTNIGIRDRAVFRLGWHYTFENPDTTLAKEYFDEILKGDKTTDIAKLVLRLYSGKRFIISFASEAEESNLKEVSDSLLNSTYTDTLATLDDSLEADIKDFPEGSKSDNPDANKPDDTSPVPQPDKDLFNPIAPEPPKVIKED